MRLLLLLIVSSVGFMVVSAAGFCDPTTEYDNNGQCCKKCDPGTYMTSHGSCLEPQCIACGNNEYQESYTTLSKCKRQPYCDPNKNFIFIAHHKSKTQQSTCMCKLGFHCSSETCLTCVPHRTCGPGYGVQSKGDQTHDTVCEVCSTGTFSNETSWDGSCQKWTECMDGYHVEEGGTGVSDNICAGKRSRWYPVLIFLAVLLLVSVIVAAGFFVWKRKGNGDAEGKMKGCMESCLEEGAEPEQTDETIKNPTPEDESKIDLITAHVPEEDEEDEESPGSPQAYTENGNYLTQEVGKDAILSRQESQTQASEITDSII